MSKARARREAAGRLGLELRRLHADLEAANGEQELMKASVPLGICFNTNIEFIIWTLLEFGGIEQKPIQGQARPLVATPAVLLQP